jgi:pimeloyl-ACP methyl ester carboxylesterase
MRSAVLALLGLLLATSAVAKPQTDDGHKCPRNVTCGTLVRPIDPSGQVKGTLAIGYRLYPHTDPNATPKETIVAQEGGPGFATHRSSSGYLTLFEPLRTDHDILMVDARGTGPTAINCPSLQHSPVRTPRDIGECGHLLGRAADYYGTRLAAQDMAAILDTLNIPVIDYYGDSYGTFFGQVFSAMYPARLRAVVLDGAYPVIGETPWYSHAGEVVRKGFDEACRRAPYCASLPGSSLERIRRLVKTVRDAPITGRATDAEGHIRTVTADPGTVGNTLYDGTEGPVIYRDLDAAARALFDNHDTKPLLRLIAESNGNEDPSPPHAYSYGLFAAVSCMDYQQIYDMSVAPPERRVQRRTALKNERASDPKVYDPLTIDEFQTVPQDISVLNLCIDWPIHNPPYTPGAPIPNGDSFTQAPTLVLNGELDMLTTAAEGAIVTKQYPHAQQIIVANSFHVDAIDDYGDCAQEIVRRFVENLDPGDISCAANINPVRLVPFDAEQAAGAIPAEPRGGNAASKRQLSVASAAVQTAGDVIARWNINYSGKGVGLRGGAWSYTQPGSVARWTLNGVRWTKDLAVSGQAVWDQKNGAIHTHLTFTDRNGDAGDLTADWNDRDHDAVATVKGTIGGNAVDATMPAP